MSAQASKDSTLKAIWKDPVWSKVISVAILAIMAGVWATIKGKWHAIGTAIWSSLASGWAWLGGTTPAWNWLLLVLGAITLFVIYAAIRLFIEWRSQEMTSLTFNDYLKDHFEGLDWHWSYNVLDQIIRLYPCCPACQLQLEPRYNAGHSAVCRISYYCEACRESRAQFNEHEDSVKVRIQRFIHQKLRTGSWKQVVEQQRGDRH